MKAELYDVEAYVKSCDIHTLVSLLSSAIGKLQTDTPALEEVNIYKCGDVSVVLQPSEDGFLSIWVRGPIPWPSCPAFGRYLASKLHCIVRCAPQNEFPQISPNSDVFLQIADGVESLVAWG